jgi:hypothetical protein
MSTFSFAARQLDDRFQRLDASIDAARTTTVHSYFASLNSTMPAKLTSPQASTYQAGA